MSDKNTTSVGGKTEDALDRLVAADRLTNRHRTDQYRQQLLNQIERNSQEKQTNRIDARQDLQTLYQNVKVPCESSQKGEELQRKHQRDRLNVERQLQQVNRMLMEKAREKHQTEPQPAGKGLLNQLSQRNQQFKQYRRQRQNMQDQMNSMQSEIKRENEMRQSSERLYEQRQHLLKMEEYVMKMQKDRQDRLQKHEQNMSLFNKMDKLSKEQQHQQDNLQEKFRMANEREVRQGQQQRINEQKRRKRQQAWLQQVQKQLTEKKKEKDQQKEQQKRERQLMDRLSKMPVQHKDYTYLKDLQRQIIEDKVRRRQQKEERLQVTKDVPTHMSPALLGKLPAGWQRLKQMQYIDKKMGFSQYQNGYANYQHSPKDIPMRQQMEMKFLYDKLRASRQHNSPRSPIDSPKSQGERREYIEKYSMGINNDVQQNKLQPLQMEQQSQVPPMQNHIQSPLNSSQLSNRSHLSRSMRVYDPITNHQRIYNLN